MRINFGVGKWIWMGLCVAWVGAVGGAQASEFCRRDAAALAEIARDPQARMAFKNPGGSMGIGVCWWHSRFQRAAWYLLDFRPDLPREPGERLAREEIRKLSTQSEVVVVPGYADFLTYSRDFRALIEEELSQWQIRDSVLHGTWVLKPSLPGRLPAFLLRRKMARLEKRFFEQDAQPIFQLIQIRKSVAIHAWLVLDISREGPNYRLQVVDSNYPDRIVEALYVDGEQWLRYDKIKGDGVIPYEFFDDPDRISDAISRFCE